MLKASSNYVWRILMLIAILVIFNYIYSKTTLEQDLQNHANLINLVRDAYSKNSQIIYLGESSNNTFRENDRDKRSISEMTASYFPDLVFGHLTKQASHAGIYYEMLQNLPEKSSIKTIIVTLNMRSFDAGWIYSNLETPLQKSIVLLKNRPPLFNRFLLSFKGYDIKTEKERESQFRSKWKSDFLAVSDSFKYHSTYDWDNGLAQNGIHNEDGTFNSALTELACHYVKTYAFTIDTSNNPRIKDFDKIVNLAAKRNWYLIFNLMAENIEKADSLVGKELVSIMHKNRDLLIHRYSKNNVIVTDNLDLVKSTEFIDQKWTTEHYAERGRKIIARNLAESLKLIYPESYKVPQQKEHIYYNDCEGSEIWGQMQTLTSKHSYSGKKSSKTDAKNNYSLTFEKELANLNEFSNRVHIQCEIYQKDIGHNAKLVLELSTQNETSEWQGKLIKDLSKTTGKWSNIDFTFDLPSNFYSADKLKIYIYNVSGTELFVDDMKIEFIE